MRIKMRTNACGPDGNLYAERSYEVADAFGDELVAGGYADNLDAPAAEPAAAAQAARSLDDPPPKKPRGDKPAELDELAPIETASADAGDAEQAVPPGRKKTKLK